MSLRGRHLVPYMPGSYDEGSHYQGNDGRLLQRERTSQVLVDKARRLNDDFLVTLSNPGNILQAAEAKALLKEHIQTITTTVATLSKDIEVLESQMMIREQSHKQSNHSVKNLELHHVGSITDLRSRVGRCDASIAKLSTQMRGIFESVSNLSKQLQDLSKNLSETIMDTSTKVCFSLFLCIKFNIS
ncbi:protein FAM81A-like [Anneissia japonica]|uniref:protein FAM81A-like n=1 Tax=Anneissia japonica TaxID=1529436 RepID=UPI00142577B5|nr:protein FAM81A-like [Anneissia japonica]